MCPVSIQRRPSGLPALQGKGWLVWAVLIALALFVARFAFLATGNREIADGPLTITTGMAADVADGGVQGAVSLFEMSRIGHHLRREKQLEGELAVLNTQLQMQASAVRESAELRRLLGLPAYTKYDYVGAEVVTRSMDFWFDALVLDKGKEAGIAEQNLVVNSQGLVGEIAEVGAGYSRIRLLTSPNFALSAVSNTSGIGGVVRGQGPARLSFEYVQADAPLKLQEKLFTAGLAPQADGKPRPRGILLGYVESIKRTENLTTLKVTARPAIDVTSIGPVVVMINK
jgi:rod shape-determining protein MreC